jgi:hypothetical protein
LREVRRGDRSWMADDSTGDQVATMRAGLEMGSSLKNIIKANKRGQG